MDISKKLIVERFKKIAEVFAKAVVNTRNAVWDFIKAKWEATKEYEMHH